MNSKSLLFTILTMGAQTICIVAEDSRPGMGDVDHSESYGSGRKSKAAEGRDELKLSTAEYDVDSRRPRMFHPSNTDGRNWSSNLNLTQETGVIFHDQESSLQSKPENNTDGNEDDDFDWRKRKDGYNLSEASDHPYAIMLYTKDKVGGQYVCSGSLITEEWVLTAAHCLYQMVECWVYAGGTALTQVLYHQADAEGHPLPRAAQLRSAGKMLLYPCYKYGEYDCDVGLVRVNVRFELTETVAVAAVATTPWTYYSYTECVVTGFGKVLSEQTTEDDYHRKTHHLHVKQPCLCSFGLKMRLHSKEVVNRYICSKLEKDYGMCEGDSGSSLVCGGLVRGVAMFVTTLLNEKTCVFGGDDVECGSENTVSVFEDICQFLPWINNYTHIFRASQTSEQCKFESKSSLVRSSALLLLLYVVIVVNIQMNA